MLDALDKFAILRVLAFFTEQHSVFGGTVPSESPPMAVSRTMMVIVPLGVVKNYLEICLFVVALVVTADMVRRVLAEQRPAMVEAVRGVVPRLREVLLLSVLYFAVMAILSAVFLFVGTSSFTPERLHQLASSRTFITVFGLATQCCLAWLLLPAAIRLLRPPGSPAISAQQRRVGTVLAVAAAVGQMLLQYAAGKAEAALMIGNVWESWTVAVVNTVIVNLPLVFLFIALALMAMETGAEEPVTVAEPELG